MTNTDTGNAPAGHKPAPFQVHSEADLHPYIRFPKIYKERKFQRPQASCGHGLLNLPPELRIQIFEYVLVLPHPIELWPETGVARHDRRQRFRDRRMYGRLIGRHHLPLGLMRTCKVIHNEASQVFYSKNEFRFSGINGCIVASAFLHTITLKNWQWLTTMTIAMPFRSLERSAYANEANPMTWLRFSEIINGSFRPGFRYPSNSTRAGRQYWQYENVFALLAWKLTQMPDLTRLTLVLPHYFVYDSYLTNKNNDFKTWSALDDLAAAKPDLQLQVVSLVETADDAIPDHHYNLMEHIGCILGVEHWYFEHDATGQWGLL